MRHRSALAASIDSAILLEFYEIREALESLAVERTILDA
jgi:hypothetical protein